MTEQFIGSWVELELQDGLRMKGIVQHIDINTKTMNMTSVTAYQNGQSFNALTCTVPGDKILNLEFSSENQSLGGKSNEKKGKVPDNKPVANTKPNQPKQAHNNNKGAPSQARAYQNLDGSYVGIGANNGNQNNSSKYGNQYQSSLDVNYDDQSLYKQTLSCEDVSDQENITLNQSSGYDYNYQKKEVKQSQNLYQQPRSYINHENGYTNQSTGYYNQNDNYLHPPNQHRNYRNKHQHHQNDKNIISDNNDSDYMSNDNRSNKHKNKGGFRKNRQNNHHSKHRSFGYGSEWASDDVSEYKEDFDFQSNLLLFDKKKVLEEIRANDTTAPGTLLVDINKKGQQSSYKDPHYHDDYQRLVKLRPDENVLSLDEREKAPAEFSDDDMLQPELNDLKISNSQLKTVTGVSCPTVSKEQMLEAVRLAVYEMGISEKQLIENGGFSISIMLLKAIGGARRLNPDNHNSCPVMVVLAGNNSTGAFSLSAAKHMSNHGVSVMTFIACKHEEMIESVAHQQAQLATFGVKELSSISDLPSHLVSPVDIILDGLLGYEFMLHEVTVDHERVLIADLIDWANANKAPVLSLELASGACNTAAGTGFSPTTTTITPKWTLCLGASKEGLKDRNTSGEVFLADMGLPHCVWKQAGVKGWKPPFGHEFVQSLEFL